jgi:trk system potassium uptake protein TrkH
MRQSLFQVVSIITTTGYATADYDQWPGLAKMVLFLLMFIGGCAGSTAGGIKIARLLLLLKMGWAQIKQAIHPRLVINITVQDKAVDYYILNTVGRFFFLYMLTFSCASLLLTATGLNRLTPWGDDRDAGVVGPGFGVLGGPDLCRHFFLRQNCFDFVHAFGRLELFTLLVLLQPEFWKMKKSW